MNDMILDKYSYIGENEAFLNLCYGYYIENLLSMKEIVKWVKITDIAPVKEQAYILPYPKIDFVIDNYVTATDKSIDTANKKIDELGLDILANGTYWHTSYDYGKDEIAEGVHRTIAIKRLYENGYWDEKKLILCLDYEKIMYSYGTYYVPNPNLTSEHFNYWFKSAYETHGMPLSVTDDGIALKKFCSKKDALDSWSIFLRNSFFDFKEKNNRIIKPSIIVNDYGEWLKHTKRD